MKNADMPAMPQAATEGGHGCYYTGYNGTGVPTGLTKREMMAMHMMQGLISANATYVGRTDDRDAMANDAVAHAEALLAELEKQQ